MAAKKDYFDLDSTISLILAIIPFTSWICGAVTRFQEGKILAGVLRLVLGWGIIWVGDLVMMITKKQIWRLL